MLGFALFVIILFLLIIYLYKSAKERPENFPPGPPKLPIWGSYWFLLKENYNLLYLSMESLGKRYKTDLLGLYFGQFPTVVALSHEMCKEVFKRDEFLGRLDTIVVRGRCHSEPKGIFFTDGPVWKEHKRFSLRHMRDYGFGRRSEAMEDLMDREIRNIIHFLHNEPQVEDLDICNKRGQVLLPDFLYGTLINGTMSAMTSSTFEHHKIRKYARAALNFVKSIDATGGALTMTPWLRYLAPNYFGYTSIVNDNGYLIDLLRELVDEHIKTFSDDHHRDLIDEYISESVKYGSDIDYHQLVVVLLDYLFPTPTGLAQSLSFYFACLINYPDVQAKVQDEIDKVVGRCRLPNLNDRKDMPYLEATIRECLRLIPATPLAVPRRCVKDTMLGGYFIPENTVVLTNLWTAHRDERVWKNADKYEPERFLDTDGNLLKKDLSLGFGIGRRVCVGETFSRQSMFLIASGILQNFNIQSSTGKPIDVDDVLFGIVLSLKKTWIQAIPRF